MNEPVTIDLDNWQPVNYSELFSSVNEVISPILEMIDELSRKIAEVIKPVIKDLFEMFNSIFETIKYIDFSHITNLFYFYDFATIDNFTVDNLKHQLPEKIIEDEAELSLSYSVIYNNCNSSNSYDKAINTEVHEKISDNNNAPLSEKSLLSSNDLVLTIAGFVVSALLMMVDHGQIGLYQAFFLFFSFLTIFHKK